MKQYLTEPDSAMPEFITIIIFIGILTIFACGAIHYRMRQAHFEMWVHEFEEILGSKTGDEDETILRDLFTLDLPIRECIAQYNEIKMIADEKK